MPLIVPDTLEIEILTEKLTPPLTMRLYGNNATPVGASTAASFTEIAGGGYAAMPLLFANWVITGGAPAIALYNTIQTWDFTAVINAPGSIYGYFVTRDVDGVLMWAERFATALVPFVPIAGSKIQVLPKFSATSQF